MADQIHRDGPSETLEHPLESLPLTRGLHRQEQLESVTGLLLRLFFSYVGGQSPDSLNARISFGSLRLTSPSPFFCDHLWRLGPKLSYSNGCQTCLAIFCDRSHRLSNPQCHYAPSE